MEEISYNMERLYLKGNWLDLIIDALGKDWLSALKRTKDVRKFEIDK